MQLAGISAEVNVSIEENRGELHAADGGRIAWVFPELLAESIGISAPDSFSSN